MSSTLFFLRYLGTRIFFPVSLFSLALIICCTLLFHHKAGKRCYRAGRILMISLVGIWFFISYTGSFWLKLWTQQYLPLSPEVLSADRAYVIAVFGSEYIPDHRLPLEMRFSGHMLLRLSEGARIARSLERRKIPYEVVVSTYAGKLRKNEIFSSVQAFFQKAGLDGCRLSMVTEARNSRQEVQHFRQRSGQLIFVSNGFHVPRLMMLARKYAVPAIAAPADALNYTQGLFVGPYPAGRNIFDFEQLCYELLGCAEVKLF